MYNFVIIQLRVGCGVLVNISRIEQNIREVLSNFMPDTFIYDLLIACGTSNASVALLRKGSRNLSKNDGEVLLKKKLFFKEEKEKIFIRHLIKSCSAKK